MKLFSVFVFTIAALLPIKANCSYNTSVLEQGLASFSAYNNAIISEDNGNFKIKFPRTDTVKQTIDDQGKIITVSGTIPEYEATVVTFGKFLGKDIYKINTTAVEALLSYLYKKYEITDVSIASLSSEIDFVPELRFIKASDINVQNIIFNSVDPKTNLKTEIGIIKKADFNSDVDIRGDKIFYDAVGSITGFNCNILFFDIVIPELVSKISAVYENVPDTDYSKFPADMSSMLQSESVLELKNSEFSILGISAKLNIGFINKSDLSSDKKSINLSGKFVASDIKVGQSVITIPQEIVVKYELGNLDKRKVENLQELQNKLRELQNDNNKNKDEEKELSKSCTKAAEEVIKDMKLNVKARAKYEKSTVELASDFRQSGDYLVGDGKILVKNFDLLYPDLSAKCEKDKQANSGTIPSSCIQNMASMSYRKYIDMQRRTTDSTGQTIDIFDINVDGTGVYINGKKARDAVKIKFDDKKSPKITTSSNL